MTGSPAPSASAGRTASAASGGVEVFATGPLHGTYAWLLREQIGQQPELATYTVMAVPIDGRPAQVVVRFRRPRAGPSIVLSRQLSPDGTRLALEQPNVGPAAHDGLLVLDLAAGRIAELARFDAMSDAMPAWSPDGTRIAFARYVPNATPVASDNGLWVMNADGSGIRRVLPAATQAQRTVVFGWTADGSGIAYGLAFEGQSYSVVDASTGTVVGPTTRYALSDAPASWRLAAPRFAGVFSEGDKGGEQRVVVADGPGAPLRTIASEKQVEPTGEPVFWNARWAPAGDELLFIRGSVRQSSLVRLSADGARRVEIATGMTPSQAEWLPDGRIAYIGNANGIGSVLRITDGTSDTALLDFLREGGATLGSLAIRTYP